MPKMISKDEWVTLFREIGLTDDQMNQWHRLFEKHHPDGHQAFLENLGLTPAKIDEIRKRFA